MKMMPCCMSGLPDDSDSTRECSQAVSAHTVMRLLDRGDLRLYRKLLVLAKRQLASIDHRLSNPGSGKWREMLFRVRHARIRSNLEKLLVRRNGAVLGIIHDLENIGADEDRWGNVDKSETDYLRFVLHGIKPAPVTEGEDQSQQEG